MPNEPVRGWIRDADGTGIAAVDVELWDSRELYGDAIGRVVTNADGSFEVELGPDVEERLIGGQARVYLKVRRNDSELANSRDLVEWDPVVPEPITVVIPAAEVTAVWEVRGTITTDGGAAAVGATAEAWDRQLVGSRRLGRADVQPDGSYAIRFERSTFEGKAAPDLEIRVPGADGETAAATSPTVFQAGPENIINLTVARDAVPRLPEYDSVFAGLSPLVADTPMADVDADGVVYLANRSGYDSRAVAMALQANIAEEQSQIPARHYYALFRSGLATDAAGVDRLSDGQFESALRSAVDAGIIADDGIDASLAVHRERSVVASGTYTPPGALSSVTDLLAMRVPDADQQATILAAIRDTADRPEDLWGRLAAADVDASVIAGLRTDGKLAMLTLQNAPLIGRLVNGAGIAAPEDLVTKGLYEADAWMPLIADDVPPGLSREEYAAGLALQVRSAYPTGVVADLVRRAEIVLPAPDAAPAVATFLRSVPEESGLGITAVKSWPGFAELDDQAKSGALAVERLSQISPSGAAIRALSQAGIGSARQVAVLDETQFLAAHGESIGSLDEARLVHRKAGHVHAFALNAAVDYVGRRNGPLLYALDGGATFDLAADPSPAMATLETLFGNMDYCSCEHCRSVLSPAAYLVDLFEMLDLTDVPHELDNPQTVLFDRRPDLQHLALTCENTNVALPYIDLVNEVLESWIVNDASLDGYRGHDTGADDVSAELLADPRWVEAAAYAPLSTAVFPTPLPFDLPLATLRRYFEAWGSSLADALDVFGDPAEVRREAIGLDSKGYRILTDAAFRALGEYFGEPATATIGDLNAAVANAKAFCRRLDVEYVDLVAILRTRFVNPGIDLVPPLEALEIGLDRIEQWSDSAADIGPQLLADLPTDLDAAAYGNDVLGWLSTNHDRLMAMIVLTPVPGADPTLDDCDFAGLELRRALPKPATNALTEADFLKLLRFIRLWRALGWSIEETDDLLVAFVGPPAAGASTADLDAAFVAGLARIGNFLRLLELGDVTAKRRPAWLALFDTSTPADARRAALSKLLKVGADELAVVAKLLGVDPVAADMDADHPSLLRAVEVMRASKESPLRLADRAWLVGDAEPSPPLTPAEPTVVGWLRAVRDAVAAADASVGTGPVAELAAVQAMLAAAFDPDLANRFVSLITGTTTYSVELDGVEESVPAVLVPAAPTLGIDPFTRRLTHVGVLTASAAAALVPLVNGLAAADLPDTAAGDQSAYRAAFAVAVDALVAAGEADHDRLVEDAPELGPVLDAALAVDDGAARLATVVELVRPMARQRLRRAAVRAAVSSVFGLDATVTAALATALAAGGTDLFAVLAQPFGSGTAQFVADAELVLDPVVAGDHTLYVVAPAGTQIALQVDGDVAIASTTVGGRGFVATAVPLSFTPGLAVRLAMEVSALPPGASVSLDWRSRGQARAPIPVQRLAAASDVTTATQALTRLHRISRLVLALGLTASEVDFFETTCPDTAGVLRSLPAALEPAANHVGLAAKVAALADFARFRSEVEPEPGAWVSALRAGRLGESDTARSLALAAGWRTDDLMGAAVLVGIPAGQPWALADLGRARRMVEIATTTAQATSDLAAWTLADPSDADVSAVHDSVRSGLDPDVWQTTVQSINDRLRNERRDALVAYILRHATPRPDVVTPDALYEYFLIDTEMDACMQTSRIRLALSTVQLFVTRCLMNLEDRVSPGSISVQHWKWMRRYRVWEANRKVFLHPENWLEPELRDLKSPQFRELEAELLKSDITDQSAELAFLNFLKKVDDVARLEVTGIFLQQNGPGRADDDIVHVFGRTSGETRQHYHRRFEYGYWTPWERIGVNIKGETLLPMMWRNQLFVFWLSSVVVPRRGSQDDQTNTDNFAAQKWKPPPPIDVDVTVAWAEYFGGKWLSPKSTNMNRPVRLDGLPSFKPESLILSGRTVARTPRPGGAEALVLSLSYHDPNVVTKAFRLTFASKNAPPQVEAVADPWLAGNVEGFNRRLFWERQNGGLIDGAGFVVPRADFTVRVTQPAGATMPFVDEMLLGKRVGGGAWRVIPAMHPVENQWQAPFFYQDEHHTFFVQGTERIDRFTTLDSYLDLPAISQIPIHHAIPELIDHPVGPEPGWDPSISPPLGAGIVKVLDSEVTFPFAGVPFRAAGPNLGAHR